MKITMALAVVSAAALAASTASAQLVRSGAGATAADISPTVSQFRTDLGVLNPNVAGPLGPGRREVNWDGVPDALSAPNNLPADFFNANSPRGVEFSTPGTGFQVSGAAGLAPIEFDNIDPTYSGLFTTFSPQRLFTALGSNILDVNFFVPGSDTAALVSGFGAVFTDVDLPNVTSIQLFGLGGVNLGTFFVPNVAGANQTLSFLGVSYAAPTISRVRITSGTDALGAGVFETASRDLVAMDDFIFGEPVNVGAPVPEPSAWALMIAGLGFTGAMLRAARKKRTFA